MRLDETSIIVGQIILTALLAGFFYFFYRTSAPHSGIGLLCSVYVLATVSRSAFLFDTFLPIRFGDIFTLVTTILIYLAIKRYCSGAPLFERKDYCLVVALIVAAIYGMEAILTQGTLFKTKVLFFTIVVLRFAAGYRLLSLKAKRLPMYIVGTFLILYGFYGMVVILRHTGIPWIDPYLAAMLSNSIFLGNVALSTALALLLLYLFGERSFHQVEQLSFVDHLTGKLNRRGIEFYLDQELARCSRNYDQFSIVLLDLDHFKIINDTYGHPAGDEALRKVVSIIESEVRSEDLIGRLGGDEIVIILPSIPGSGAFTSANRICEAVASSGHSPFKLSLSIGVTEYHCGDSARTLLQRVDTALYDAKRSGRSCARFALATEDLHADNSIPLAEFRRG
ncbi:GGDEF domain-containing protein [Terriglobus tenax]|uniref:GGDEF domain-containing protein n=1 Tax=Terriglobus tenax TaxID=1111115 RepID=UPI0021DF78AD|nr:GGDEF domain-containing protein [Terriglobus tenax]